uniref:Uncharacterized protein n=1 Tax=Palpitomonas bilix TaxID=652834 RepID=A0A7S3G9W8_9EUKA|mmetsp:Transcript_33895/g.87015  ORF Transcript_33895/g.87015 Transcript_33895/m.87015 type:complete len:103 (+) Transcript_33895:1042-1350(+)
MPTYCACVYIYLAERRGAVSEKHQNVSMLGFDVCMHNAQQRKGEWVCSVQLPFSHAQKAASALHTPIPNDWIIEPFFRLWRQQGVDRWEGGKLKKCSPVSMV